MLPLTVIFLTVFIDLVGFGMIIPLTPYLGKAFGADAFTVGLLMASYSAFQFLFSPFWGRLSDRHGRRPILLMSLFGSAVAHALFAFAPSLIWLFVSRIFGGIFAANISTAMAYIADVTEEKDRSKGMGLIGAAFGLGFVVGPALGGVLATDQPNSVAYFAAAICLANFLVALKVLKESLKEPLRRERPSRWRAFIGHWRRPLIPTLLSVSFVNSLGLATVEAVLFFLVADRFQWSLREASFGFAYVGIAMAFTQGLIVRRLLPRWGEKNVLLTGAILFSAAMLLTGFAHDLATVAVAMTLLALGTGFVNPSVNGSVSLLTPAHQQGETMGVVQSLAALARIAGPPMGGFLYSQLGQSSPFVFSAACGALGVTLISLAYKQLPMSAKTGARKSAKEDFPVNAVGLFQLQNIVAGEVPYLLIDVRERPQPFAAHAELFRKVKNVPAGKVVEHLRAEAVDSEFPIILCDQQGECAPALAQELEKLGYINVYYVLGGIQALNDTAV